MFISCCQRSILERWDFCLEASSYVYPPAEKVTSPGQATSTISRHPSCLLRATVNEETEMQQAVAYNNKNSFQVLLVTLTSMTRKVRGFMAFTSFHCLIDQQRLELHLNKDLLKNFLPVGDEEMTFRYGKCSRRALDMPLHTVCHFPQNIIPSFYQRLSDRDIIRLVV